MEKIQLTLVGENNFFIEEAYKVLRSNLQFCGQDIKVIGITSCMENEGKTTISTHVSKSFSELGKKVIFIDADMRQSILALQNSETVNAKGLSEVLSGMEKVENCIYKCQYENMDIMFAGKYPPNPSELLEGKYFTQLIEKLKTIYDYIIIDTPPIDDVIDAAIISKACDGMVLVIKKSRVRRRLAQSCVLQLKKAGCRILGVVRKEGKSQSGMAGKKRYGYGNKENH